jgi:hypothetical protein
MTPAKYDAHKPVYSEEFDDSETAIRGEKQLGAVVPCSMENLFKLLLHGLYHTAILFRENTKSSFVHRTTPGQWPGSFLWLEGIDNGNGFIKCNQIFIQRRYNAN